MKQYKSIDLAKFICAILIIILHTAPFADYSRVLTVGFRNIVTVIAVPFFFCASGFLAFTKADALQGNEKKTYIKRYLKRLIVMYLIWSAVYFVFVVVKWTRAEFTIWTVLEYVKDFFFEGSYSTIWYLPALFMATLLVYLLHKKLSYKTIFFIACAVYLFTLGGSSYYGLATKVGFIKQIYDVYYSFFDTIKNGVCFGMIYVCLGAMASEREDKLIQKSWKKSILPVLAFGLAFAAEELLIGILNWNLRGVDTTAFLVPLTWVLFVFVLRLDLPLKDETCTGMRKYSILMFLCQRIPLSIIDLFLPTTILATNSMLYFITVLIVTLFISFAILQASKKWKWLKYAY